MCSCKGEITYSAELFDGYVYTVPSAEMTYKEPCTHSPHSFTSFLSSLHSFTFTFCICIPQNLGGFATFARVNTSL